MRSSRRKILARGAIVLGAVGAAGAATVAGCSSQGTQATGGSASSPTVVNTTPASDTGNVGMQLTLPGGEQVNAVQWVITGPNGASTVVETGTVDLSNSTTVSFLVGGIPAGGNYSIALSGTSADGTVTCAGSATFNVVAQTTTNVSVALQCNATLSEAGSAQINGSTYNCASVSSIAASPAETTLGSAVAITGVGNGPNAAGLTYAWSAPSGSFSAPTGAATNFTCTAPGPVALTLTVGDGPVVEGGACDPTVSTRTITIQCDTASGDAGSAPDAGDGGSAPAQALVTTIGAGVSAIEVTINQGTAIGEGSLNGATPATLANLRADPNNTETINSATNPFSTTGNVPDTAAGFCTYPDAGTPKRVSYVTGSKFETSGPGGDAAADPMVPMSPFYFPLVYTTTNTTVGNAFGGQPPIIGLFDWRPKDIDEGLVAAESDDLGKTWYFMQLVLELNPDYTNPISGGYSPTATSTGCPATIGSTNANFTSANGSQADDGWGHATVIQLPGTGNVKTGQYLYMLDRNTNNIPGTTTEIVDGSPLWVINLAPGSAGGGSTNKFPIWNSNFTGAGNNDIKSISSALNNTPDAAVPVVVQQTVGLTDPDGIMAVFPAPSAAAGSAVTVLYVQKILGGDNTGSTALPAAQQCNKAPFSQKTNHDISNVRLATTTDGVHFTDLGIVNGLNDPTTVDYNKTRWISPRATILDVNGDGSLWGMYFSGGNCLDGDSDAFHYIGYAESTDMRNWVVYNDINHPIASINTITTANQAGGATVTVPANLPVIATQPWFAQRLYAPTAVRIDATHLSLTFAGYGVQTPANDLLNYRSIGNVVLTVSKALPAGVPNNINAH
jgi:hypothetical protein